MKQNFFKSMAVALCAAILLSGCASMNNTAKGSMIGAAGGAALGLLIGHLAGNKAVGTAVGTAVGAGTGAIIGHRMDKAAEAASEIDNATVETITDANNNTAVKITFNSGILFATNKYNLNDADVAIFGHTDSTGNDAINDPLSVNRANSVATYLKGQGVSASQIKSVEGCGSKYPVADNATAAGREQNRRVEVYLYAGPKMIEAAKNGTLKQ